MNLQGSLWQPPPKANSPKKTCEFCRGTGWRGSYFQPGKRVLCECRAEGEGIVATLQQLTIPKSTPHQLSRDELDRRGRLTEARKRGLRDFKKYPLESWEAEAGKSSTLSSRGQGSRSPAPGAPEKFVSPDTNLNAIVSTEANRLDLPLKGNFSAMARKRHQHPTPFKEGNWWWVTVWQDQFIKDSLTRKRKRIRLIEAGNPKREALERAEEELVKLNSFSVGSATRFHGYIETTYRPVEIPQMATTTQVSYDGTLRKYLLRAFGNTPLRDMNTLMLQSYFTGLGTSNLSGETVLKIKEVLSAVLGSAVRYGFLPKNPLPDVRIPRSKAVNRRKPKPYITPEEFDRLVEFVDEPYSTMIYVAVFSGLRVSELIGLKWEDVHDDALMVDERYCRGDWSVTKTSGSAAPVWVAPSVIARIRRLKTIEIEINWGGSGARKRIKLVRSDGPTDLVFQSLRKGAPMRDGNVLRRHIRPAAIRLGMDPKKATWRSLRTSCATWMIEAGANPKDVQAQMRHSRIGTTMDTYAQHVPESQRRAVAKMMDMVESRQSNAATIH